MTNCAMCGKGPIKSPAKYCSDDCRRAMRAAKHRQWRAENGDLARERTRLSMRKHRAEHPVQVSVNKRAWLYGITPDQFMRMLDSQQWQCDICYDGIDIQLAFVDHDHGCCSGVGSCGRCVRALLCRRCNAFLGMAQDDPERLKRAAAYLESHAALRAV